jgi:N6-adenosine-specific RNA methylase IME4
VDSPPISDGEAGYLEWCMGKRADLLSDRFAALRPEGGFGVIYADPPWQFKSLWGTATGPGNRNATYNTMDIDDICALPVRDLAADNCVLFMWSIWILMPRAFDVIKAWGFEYKTCAFDWVKANPRQIDMFRDDADVQMGLGYWTRANSEPCLLATRGSPKRLSKSVRQGVIEPRREHSRKPDCIYGRIERLVAGPYIELFARQQRPGWTSWGDETGKFTVAA